MDTGKPLGVDGAFTFKTEEKNINGEEEVVFFNILKSKFCPEFPQVTVSRSQRNVIRGLHCSPYHKLVCCPTGKAFDVCVDLRPDSPTFLKWDSAWLDKTTQILIPPFCAHGFFAAEDNTSIVYLQGGCFNTPLDFSVRFDDPAIGVKWPSPIEADDYIISPKDRANPLTSEELFSVIKSRIGSIPEALEKGPFADFAIIADTPSNFIQTVMLSIQKKGKNWHFCSMNGNHRASLQEELWALKPRNGVIYIASGKDSSDLENVTKILNVVGACNALQLKLTIVFDGDEFPLKGKVEELIQQNSTIKCQNAPKDPAEVDSIINLLL
ncbi:dTDP-4-dehydrorhamnose 3,5-epimerase [Histomonas meleagridis]|uniref:dTDP-4-dehydrorhamnose 3,5-epimerase n=1 Tax=Histomonas meleagridis TaxID=135588 RepID=UPI003559E0CF|nr:dTDP-4-dehydrorhamnose 3,5-epimerase [Histomonas meleagridis]KAH0806240.1 dTDP-4-dehydrorhamnose 3,5-epimerase [Histomonas meleagridis]